MGADKRLIAATLALTLIAMPLMAGCIGVAQASAMDHQETATERAHEWDPDARLVSVTGVEGTHWMGAMAAGWSSAWSGWGAQAPQDPYWDRAEDDERVGDGRCEIWVYEFISPTKDQKLQIVTDRDGKIIHEDTERRDHDDQPVGEWRIDSDKAMEIALKENSGLRRGIESDNYGLVLHLERDDDDDTGPNAYWAVMGGGGDNTGSGGGMVVIDAVTGKVHTSRGGHSTP